MDEPTDFRTRLGKSPPVRVLGKEPVPTSHAKGLEDPAYFAQSLMLNHIRQELPALVEIDYHDMARGAKEVGPSALLTENGQHTEQEFKGGRMPQLRIPIGTADSPRAANRGRELARALTTLGFKLTTTETHEDAWIEGSKNFARLEELGIPHPFDEEPYKLLSFEKTRQIFLRTYAPRFIQFDVSGSLAAKEPIMIVSASHAQTQQFEELVHILEHLGVPSQPLERPAPVPVITSQRAAVKQHALEKGLIHDKPTSGRPRTKYMLGMHEAPPTYTPPGIRGPSVEMPDRVAIIRGMDHVKLLSEICDLTAIPYAPTAPNFKRLDQPSIPSFW